MCFITIFYFKNDKCFFLCNSVCKFCVQLIRLFPSKWVDTSHKLTSQCHSLIFLEDNVDSIKLTRPKCRFTLYIVLRQPHHPLSSTSNLYTFRLARICLNVVFCKINVRSTSVPFFSLMLYTTVDVISVIDVQEVEGLTCSQFDLLSDSLAIDK